MVFSAENFKIRDDGDIYVECLDDLTFAYAKPQAIFELDVRFTKLPFRYAPVRFRASQHVVQDVFDMVEVSIIELQFAF